MARSTTPQQPLQQVPSASSARQQQQQQQQDEQQHAQVNVPTSRTSSGARLGDNDGDASAGGCPALSNSTLLLSPHASEARFWGSLRVLRTLDGVGLFNSVVLNVMLIRKFGWGREHPDWLWHFLPILLYLSAGILQLLLLIFRPRVHQRHRFAINLVNRLVKAATVTWGAVNMKQTDVMLQFAGMLNSAAVGEASPSTGTYMAILRTVAGLPLLWLTHAVNFIVPFCVLLPLQLYTLLAVRPVIPSIVCALLGQPPHIVQAACDLAARVRTLVRVMIALTLPMVVQPARARTAASAAAAAAADSPEKDLLLLACLTFMTILLLIPCLIGYHVELLTKTNFVEAERRRLTPSDSGSDAAALHCVPAVSRSDRAVWRLLLCFATFDVICVALMLCETVVEGMAPVTCEAA